MPWGPRSPWGETQGWDRLNPRQSLRYLLWGVTGAAGGLGAPCCDASEQLPMALLALEAHCCGWSWPLLMYLFFFFFFLPHGCHSFRNILKEEGVWGREHPHHQNTV